MILYIIFESFQRKKVPMKEHTHRRNGLCGVLGGLAVCASLRGVKSHTLFNQRTRRAGQKQMPQCCEGVCRVDLCITSHLAKAHYHSLWNNLQTDCITWLSASTACLSVSCLMGWGLNKAPWKVQHRRLWSSFFYETKGKTCSCDKQPNKFWMYYIGCNTWVNSKC